jgi:hypothetical protein
MSLRSSGKEKATHEDEGSEDRGEQRGRTEGKGTVPSCKWICDSFPIADPHPLAPPVIFLTVLYQII